MFLAPPHQTGTGEHHDGTKCSSRWPAWLVGGMITATLAILVPASGLREFWPRG